MGIRAIYPDIKPSLNLDFANTKQLDPRITFTRTTTARYYDGKTVAKAEENLILRSQEFDNASWTKTTTTVTANNATAPDGTATAETLLATGANATTLQTVTTIAGDYTFSVWLRRVTGTGNVDITAHSGGTWVTQKITSSWARYTVTQTLTAGSRTPGIRLVTDTDSVEAWGAQLEQRSSVTAYTATTTQPITNYIPVLQTAAAGQARFDHNPTTGESLGLLIEEQRTNYVLYSEDLTNAAWASSPSGSSTYQGTGSQAIVTANQGIAPNGTLTADRIVLALNGGTTSSDRSGITQAVVASSGTYTYSFYIKSLTATSSSTLAQAISTNVGAITSSTIQDVGNGWVRAWCTGSYTNGTSMRIQITGTSGINTADFLIWGVQAEAGAFPTSYIPTTTASATRNADAASMTGTNFSSWYNAGEGTVYTEINPKALAVSSGVTINDNSTSNRIRVTTNSTSDQSLITTNGAAQATLDGGTPAADTTMKLATAYKVNDFALSLNGGTVATDTSGTVPVVSQLQIGAETTTVGNLTLKKVAYYPKRITDAELQSITA